MQLQNQQKFQLVVGKCPICVSARTEVFAYEGLGSCPQFPS